ncbi:MAG: 30S ribosomal protein S6e [Candidatus Aenigmarchaeota archaeon]|nr:30S ribosomal protein S6e [Candidatus Aenigmarchaeota archaeon]
MVNVFKIVVADPKTRRTYQKEVSQKESGLLGRKIGDKVKGDFLGLPGYELQITGGSDKQGFPMRPEIPGTARKRVLLTGGPGFHPRRRGERRRKSVRGNTISNEIVQVNMKVIKYGKDTLAKLFGKEEKPKEKAEARTEKSEAKKQVEVKQEKAEAKEEKKESEEKVAEKKKDVSDKGGKNEKANDEKKDLKKKE